jgi:hypothetical protein
MVTLFQTGHISEIIGVKTICSGLSSIKKLSQDEYIVTDTGEIMQYVKSENRADNMQSLKSSMTDVQRLINQNFNGGPSEIFFCLTYAEKMTDNKKMTSDLKYFNEKLRRAGYDLDSITVVEPQGDGKKYGNEWHANTWHAHILAKNKNGKPLFIPFTVLAKIWGHGTVKIKRLLDVDNVGVYVTSYFTTLDPEYERDTESGEEPQGRADKRLEKGQRLKYYPPGMKFFRCSRGIVHPEPQKMSYEEAKRKIGDCRADFSQTIIIQDPTSMDILNEVSHEYYNTVRASKNKRSCSHEKNDRQNGERQNQRDPETD